MTQLTGKPVVILKEGSKRVEGQDAQKINIKAARVISEAVKSTLGPRGMDKMLVDRLGGIVITNDGATILEELEIEHPAGKMIVEVARALDDEVGDGTTSAVIMTGELLKRSEILLDLKVHPTHIVKGFKKALSKSEEILEDISISIDPEKDTDILHKIALTSLNSKAVSTVKDRFAKICVEAVMSIKETRGTEIQVNVERIQIQKRQGGSLTDTKLIKGAIIAENIAHPEMPRKIVNAKIALIDCPLEIEKTKIDAQIRITDIKQIKALHDEEEEILARMVDKIKKTGATIVFCQKGINDIAQEFMLQEGIMAISRIKKKEMIKLKMATQGKIITDINDLVEDDLGEAELVEERLVSNKKFIFIEGCKNPKSVAVLLRGGVDNLLDEAERALHDGFSVIADVLQKNKVLGGGGSVEVELAKNIRRFAQTVGGKEQLAIEIYCDALEAITRTLITNSGFDPIDNLVLLRAAHENPESKWLALNLYDGKIANMFEIGVIEPLWVKIQELRSAVEAASMILRIDDVVAAKLMSPEAHAGAPMPGLPPDRQPKPTI